MRNKKSNEAYVPLFTLEERTHISTEFVKKKQLPSTYLCGNLFMQFSHIESLKLPIPLYALLMKLTLEVNKNYWNPIRTTLCELRETLNFQVSLEDFERNLAVLENLSLIEIKGKAPRVITYFVIPYVTKDYYDNKGYSEFIPRKSVWGVDWVDRNITVI